jgi:hypothetical protein
MQPPSTSAQESEKTSASLPLEVSLQSRLVAAPSTMWYAQQIPALAWKQTPNHIDL